MNRKDRSYLFLILLPIAVLLVSPVAADTFEEHRVGERSYRLYAPEAPSSDSLPLVVMLHGCTQSSKQFAAETRMNQLAEQEGFLVLYPDQVRAAQRYKCWNFYEPAQRERGRGEAALIRAMVKDAAARRAVDRRRVYAAGFSGGAGMAVHLGVAYPDVFAAVAVHSGFEYGAADGVAEALTAMEEGGPDPLKMGREAYAEMGSRADAVPTIVIHGKEDEIVYPINGRQAARQAIQTLDLVGDGVDDDYIDADPESVVKDSTPGHDFTRREYRFKDGRLGVVEYRIEGMAHSWSGGSPEGAYVDPDAPDATRIIWEFFERHTLRRVDVKTGDGKHRKLEASFRVTPSLVLAGRSVTLEATNREPEAEYQWTLGNGQTAAGSKITTRYEEPGRYRVVLRVEAPDRGSDTTARVVTVVEG